ncbi:MAG: aspartate aminotransferase family protein [Phycisphaerae bacterium]
MTTATSSTPVHPSIQPLGHQLAASPSIDAAIRAIVDEVRAKSVQITDARPANPGLKESYEGLMARAAAVRGRPLLYPYIGSGLGNGALVELADGSVKWDLISGIGVNFFGHSDPELMHAALRASLADTVKQGNLQANFEPHAFSETLLAEAAKGSKLKHAYLTTSGVMANENALKVCMQKHHPASRVLAFRDCFMGRSLMMASIGDSHEGRVGLPIVADVDYMPFYDEAAAARTSPAAVTAAAVSRLEEYIHRYPGQHACFIFELTQGEGGFNVGRRDFFRALMEVCKAHKIAVWDDEIQTFGRLPRMFAYEYYGVGDLVDVFCVGKMTQVCATLYTEEYNPKPGLLSGTFLGEAVSFEVGRRVIERLRDGDYYDRVDDKGNVVQPGRIARHHAAFVAQVKALAARHPEWFPAVPEIPDVVGGVGGMMRFTPFGGRKDKIQAACKAIFEAGVVLFYCGHGPYHLRVLPPLGVMNEQDWPRVFACIEQGLAKVPN